MRSLPWFVWPIAIVVALLLIEQHRYGALLDDALQTEQLQSQRWYHAIASRVQNDTRLIGPLLYTLDSLKARRPVTRVLHDTVRTGLPIDTLPRVMVVVDSVAYPTHIPVANALDHFKLEAQVTDTLRIPVERLIVRVDTLLQAADTAIAKASKQIGWIHRAVRWTLRTGCVMGSAVLGNAMDKSKARGTALGAGAGVVVCSYIK